MAKLDGYRWGPASGFRGPDADVHGNQGLNVSRRITYLEFGDHAEWISVGRCDGDAVGAIDVLINLSGAGSGDGVGGAKCAPAVLPEIGVAVPGVGLVGVGLLSIDNGCRRGAGRAYRYQDLAEAVRLEAGGVTVEAARVGAAVVGAGAGVQAQLVDAGSHPGGVQADAGQDAVAAVGGRREGVVEHADAVGAVAVGHRLRHGVVFVLVSGVREQEVLGTAINEASVLAAADGAVAIEI